MPSLLPCHHPHRAWSVAGVFHIGEVSMPREGLCNRADFMETSQIPRNCGETEHAQTVCTRLSLLHRTHKSLGMRLHTTIILLCACCFEITMCKGGGGRLSLFHPMNEINIYVAQKRAFFLYILHPGQQVVSYPHCKCFQHL